MVLAQKDTGLVAGNTEQTRPENRVAFPALDGIRAVAFLMVLGQHYLFLPWGWTGVNVFFVLSGFLITGILLDTRDQRHRARNFYVRRTLRIFPLYYGLIVVLLLLYPWFHWQWAPKWLPWAVYLGNFLRFLSPKYDTDGTVQEAAADAHLRTANRHIQQLNLGHLWSLCVEEQFYLVWPWVVFIVRRRSAMLWICGSTVVLLPIVRWIVSLHAPLWMLDSELLYRATPFELDGLLLGGLMALLWRGEYRSQLLTMARWLSATMLAIAAVYTTVTLVQAWRAAPFFSGLFPFPYHQWRLTWGLTYINVLSGSLILRALVPGTFTYRIFHIAALRWLGRISYGLYVFHDLFHVLYMREAGRICTHLFPSNYVGMFLPSVSAALALGSTILLAWLSYRFFEGPILNLKERWTIRG